VRRLLPLIVSGALGLDLWAILVCLPALHVGIGPAEWALCLIPLVPLLAGAILTLGRGILPRGRELAPAMLLLGFPAALLLPLVILRDLTGVNVYGPWNIIVAVLALLAYGGGTLLVLARLRGEPSPHRSVPIQGWTIDPPARRRRNARIVVLSAAALIPVTTLSAAFVRPGLADEVGVAYGKAAGAATVGIGAIGLALSLGVLLVYFAPPLRRPAPEEPIPSPARRLRSTVLLLVLAAGASIALLLLRVV
jgi:hypothetical protein